MFYHGSRVMGFNILVKKNYIQCIEPLSNIQVIWGATKVENLAPCLKDYKHNKKSNHNFQI